MNYCFQRIKADSKFFLCNKKYMFIVGFIVMLSFSYEIINACNGVDDICVKRYFEDGLGLTIGRWPFFVLNKLGIRSLNIFVPYVIDMLAVIILFFAAIVWSMWLQRKFTQINLVCNIRCYIVFSSLLISVSYIGYVFIYYLHNGVALGFLLIGLIFYINDFELNNIMIYIIQSLLLTLAISFYESFTSVFILAYILQMFFGEIYNHYSILSRMKKIFYGINMLITAIILRSAICLILRGIYSIPLKMRTIEEAKWLFQSGWEKKIWMLFVNNIKIYCYPRNNASVILFDIAIISLLVISIYLSFSKKNGIYLFYYFCMFISNFVISLFLNTNVEYRCAQSISLFIAIGIMIVTVGLEKFRLNLKIIAYLVIIILEYNNICELNFLFYTEKQNYEINMNYLRNVANDISSQITDEKPVVFIGTPQLNLLTGSDMNTINQGIIEWGENAFNEGNIELGHYFQLLGYNFNIGSKDQYYNALQKIDELSIYPYNGYILEEDDYYIIRF